MRGKLYVKNAALLTVGGFALRVLGMAFRVYIAAWLGGEGMGLYQLILAVYGVFIALASAGVNVASTKLAAQSLARGHGMSATLWGLVSAAALFGTGAMLAQFALVAPLAHFMLHDARAELGLRVLAPSLPFMAVAGALRGCFLARRRVTPNILSQLAEQALRMAVAALALRKLAAWGAAYACAAVLLGNTLSEALSCVLMALFAKEETSFRRQEGDGAVGFSRRELLGIALPVTGSRLLASALQAVESSLIPLCLALCLGERTAAMEQYGAVKGMAMPLIFFPFSVLAALSGLLMPEIARAAARRDKQATARLVGTAMTLTGLFSALAGAGLLLFGEELALLLYRDTAVGMYVRVLGLIAPFMYLESMIDGILKGLGEQLATFRYSLLDSAVRITAVCVVVPRFGILGFLGVMAFSNLLTCTLNARRMLLRTRMRPTWDRWLIAPAALAGAAATPVLWLRRFGPAGPAGLALQLTVFAAGAGLPLLWLWRKNRTALAPAGAQRAVQTDHRG